MVLWPTQKPQRIPQKPRPILLQAPLLGRRRHLRKHFSVYHRQQQPTRSSQHFAARANEVLRVHPQPVAAITGIAKGIRRIRRRREELKERGVSVSLGRGLRKMVGRKSDRVLVAELELR